MQTATQQIPISPSLTAISGFKGKEEQLAHFVEAAWLATYTSLFNGTVFTTQHIQHTKATLRQWLLNQPNTAMAYQELVQRVLLAKWYVSKHGYKYFPATPMEWLDDNNLNGFAGTQKWYIQLMQKRAAMPLYQLVLKAFAEAVLEMHEEPSGRNFHYWRSYFIEHDSQQLLNLFLSVVAWGRFCET
jgi:hypothetical protein